MCLPSFPLEIGFHGLGDGSTGKVLVTKSSHLSLIPGGHIKEEGKALRLLASAIAGSTHEEDEEEEIKERK